jgi:hypothetical protein
MGAKLQHFPAWTAWNRPCIWSRFDPAWLRQLNVIADPGPHRRSGGGAATLIQACRTLEPSKRVFFRRDDADGLNAARAMNVSGSATRR